MSERFVVKKPLTLDRLARAIYFPSEYTPKYTPG